MSSENRLREIIRAIISEESNVLILRTPGSDHYGYSASHPKKIRTRRPSLGFEEDADSYSEEPGPVIVSRAFDR
jgi:hypothetical protein